MSPQTPCPACDGHGYKDCPLCFGRGHVSQVEARNYARYQEECEIEDMQQEQTAQVVEVSCCQECPLLQQVQPGRRWYVCTHPNHARDVDDREKIPEDCPLKEAPLTIGLKP